MSTDQERVTMFMFLAEHDAESAYLVDCVKQLLDRAKWEAERDDLISLSGIEESLRNVCDALSIDYPGDDWSGEG